MPATLTRSVSGLANSSGSSCPLLGIAATERFHAVVKRVLESTQSLLLRMAQLIDIAFVAPCPLNGSPRLFVAAPLIEQACAQLDSEVCARAFVRAEQLLAWLRAA